MKTKLLASLGWGSRALLGTAMFLLIALAAPSHATPFALPTGNDWDCITSGGGQDGVMFLHFTTDLDTNGFATFEGIFAIAGQKNFPTVNARTGLPGSSGTGRTNTSFPGFTNLFGAGFVGGPGVGFPNNGGDNDWLTDSRGFRGVWFFDSKGRIVGSYFIVENVTGVVSNYFAMCTNVILSVLLTNGTIYNTNYGEICFSNGQGPTLTTNLAWGPASDGETGTSNITLVNTNFNLVPVGTSTNAVDFVGTVVPGKRLTLTGSSLLGRVLFHGVPLVPLVNVTDLATANPWVGQKLQDGITYRDFFTMAPLLSNTNSLFILPNAFALSGENALYTYEGGLCLISSQKKIGFGLVEAPVGNPNAPGNLRGTYGSYSVTRTGINAKTTGLDSGTTNRIRFSASTVEVP